MLLSLEARSRGRVCLAVIPYGNHPFWAVSWDKYVWRQQDRPPRIRNFIRNFACKFLSSSVVCGMIAWTIGAGLLKGYTHSAGAGGGH